MGFLCVKFSQPFPNKEKTGAWNAISESFLWNSCLIICFILGSAAPSFVRGFLQWRRDSWRFCGQNLKKKSPKMAQKSLRRSENHLEIWISVQEKNTYQHARVLLKRLSSHRGFIYSAHLTPTPQTKCSVRCLWSSPIEWYTLWNFTHQPSTSINQPFINQLCAQTLILKSLVNDREILLLDPIVIPCCARSRGDTKLA